MTEGTAPQEILVATGNRGKFAEFERLLGSFTLRRQDEFELLPAEETAPSFVENAILKARAASAQTGLAVLADDSGLAVTALGGAPGVRSARFAADAGVSFAEEDRDAANRQQLLEALRGVPSGERQAAFHCALVLLRHAEDPIPIIAEGVWRGEILEVERGHGGFGYDPLFNVPEYGCSAAELEAEVKNAISHRGLATQALLRRLADA
ncbi:MAG: RdgB/HAM1 family non-canonical purine NTP pyrophosphatase [Halieaceae bacterium]|jgi:XTP/dITP diphosphohydrolase|nr:RdgB/HAM1 family non-canonical purine NTP pyrophosphatase [Halieaceae bacterium]